VARHIERQEFFGVTNKGRDIVRPLVILPQRRDLGNATRQDDIDNILSAFEILLEQHSRALVVSVAVTAVCLMFSGENGGIGVPDGFG
jgi:hypothetical protein